MLHVLTYIVSVKLFCDWIEIVRFVSQEGLFDKGWLFDTLLFGTNCLVVITQYLSIGIRIIFTTSELIDKISNSKSNASQVD